MLRIISSFQLILDIGMMRIGYSLIDPFRIRSETFFPVDFKNFISTGNTLTVHWRIFIYKNYPQVIFLIKLHPKTKAIKVAFPQVRDWIFSFRAIVVFCGAGFSSGSLQEERNNKQLKKKAAKNLLKFMFNMYKSKVKSVKK